MTKFLMTRKQRIENFKAFLAWMFNQKKLHGVLLRFDADTMTKADAKVLRAKMNEWLKVHPVK